MRSLLVVLSCFLLASCVNNVSVGQDVDPVAAMTEIDPFKIDPIATVKNAQRCNVGKVEGSWLLYAGGPNGEHISISDVCLGVNHYGYYIFEKLYVEKPEIEGRKRTDPYLSKPINSSDDSSILIRGFYIEWFSDGSKRSECYFNENGTPAEKPCIYWHDNGQKAIEVGYVPIVVGRTAHSDSQAPTYKWGYNGSYKSWHRNGGEDCSGVYKEGENVGTFTCWHENGQKKSEMKHKGKKGLVKATEWYEDGQKETEKIYGYFSKYYVSRFWSKKGHLIKEENYKGYSLHGVSTKWYENGQEKIKENYKKGELHGSSTEWHENGQKKIEGYYQKTNFGVGRSGIWRGWDEDGNLSWEDDYGVLIWERKWKQ